MKPDNWTRRQRSRLPDAEELVPHTTFLLLTLTSILQPPASLAGQRGRQLLVETCVHKMARSLSAVSLFISFIYLIFVLFNDAVSNSEYIVSNGRNNSEELIGKDLEGRGSGLAFALRDFGQPRKTCIRVAGVLAEIRTKPRPQCKSRLLSLYKPARYFMQLIYLLICLFYGLHYKAPSSTGCLCHMME
jgi:hypothetical protein